MPRQAEFLVVFDSSLSLSLSQTLVGLEVDNVQECFLLGLGFKVCFGQNLGI